MKTQVKPIITLVAGAILLSGAFSPTAQANTLISSGTSTLAPSVAPTGGYGANPQEYLTISWSVSENASDIYTYSYTVNNPAGDVLLNSDGSLTSTSEIVDDFDVTFNTTVPGAYLSGSQSGGAYDQVENVGLNWAFAAVAAGSSSAALTFQSTLGPLALGNASANDADPPSPWTSTSPHGQQVPVPQGVPERVAKPLLALPLLLLIFHFPLRRRFPDSREESSL
jgi:hypothetical protein